MRKIVTTTIPLTEAHKKTLNVKNASELNGVYLYDTDTVVVNVGSQDFKRCRTEDQIIHLFSQQDTHETLHGIAFEITGRQTNDTEERFIQIMTGER